MSPRRHGAASAEDDGDADGDADGHADGDAAEGAAGDADDSKERSLSIREKQSLFGGR